MEGEKQFMDTIETSPGVDSIEIEDNPEELFFEKAYAKVLQVANILKQMGYTLCESLLDHDKMHDSFIRKNPFPLIREGANGIRCSINFVHFTDPGYGELIVWYTNGFEGEDNPKRLAVQEKLVAEGLKKDIKSVGILLD